MSGRTARAAVLTAPRKPFEIRTFSVPPPGPGAALLRTSCCTVCGSDVHAWTGARPPTFLPAIIGHEVAGVIEALGPDPPADHTGAPLAVGDRVTFGLTAGCGRCFYCAEAGLPQKCVSLFKYGHTACEGPLALTGGLAEFVYLVPGTDIFRVPDRVSDGVAATAMCAGATLVHALEGIAGPGYRSIVLMGMGMLGLWGLRIALDRGMEAVLCLDVDEARLAFARDAGATEALSVAGRSVEEVVAFVRSHTSGRGGDVCVDLTGRPGAITMGLEALRTGGTMALVGAVVPSGEIPVDPFRMVTGALTARGVHNYRPEHLGEALRLVEDRDHHDAIAKAISRRFPLDAVGDAFRAAHNREAHRVAVTFQESKV